MRWTQTPTSGPQGGAPIYPHRPHGRVVGRRYSPLKLAGIMVRFGDVGHRQPDPNPTSILQGHLFDSRRNG
jgi:hypothetical protein